jgi:predicted protein tyrosine phosphatase
MMGGPMKAPLKILFVCGRNNRRGPTAERMYLHDHRLAVRAVGLHEMSKRRITAEDMAWADLVLVMERKYVVRLKDLFRKLDTLPPIEILGIPDEYIFMQRELIEALKPAVESALEDYRLEQEAKGAAD